MECVDWMPGEVVSASITADGFFIGVSPLDKLVAAWAAFIAKITGGHIRVHVVVTNLRVLLVQSTQALCGFSRARGVNAIALGSLAQAGWSKNTEWCFFHTRLIQMESKTETYTLVIKQLNDAALREFITNVSGTITANAQAGTAA